jgi:hypothetical protein
MVRLLAVLDVPNSALGSNKIRLWHRTLVPADGSSWRWVQAERGARPAQLFLILGLPDAERDAYLTGEPADDGRFIEGFAHALLHTGGYLPEEARQVAETMLPEILPMTQPGQRHSRAMAARSPTTRSMPSWGFSQTGR